MIEHFFQCPYCWEQISMFLDSSIATSQNYVEDCEVCCNPIDVQSQFVNNELQDFRAISLEQ